MFASFGLRLVSVVAAHPHLNDLRETVTDALVCTLPRTPRCDRLHHARPALSTTPPHLCHRRQAQRLRTVRGLVARSLTTCRKRKQHIGERIQSGPFLCSEIYLLACTPSQCTARLLCPGDSRAEHHNHAAGQECTHFEMEESDRTLGNWLLSKNL